MQYRSLCTDDKDALQRCLVAVALEESTPGTSAAPTGAVTPTTAGAMASQGMTSAFNIFVAGASTPTSAQQSPLQRAGGSNAFSESEQPPRVAQARPRPRLHSQLSTDVAAVAAAVMAAEADGSEVEGSPLRPVQPLQQPQQQQQGVGLLTTGSSVLASPFRASRPGSRASTLWSGASFVGAPPAAGHGAAAPGTSDSAGSPGGGSGAVAQQPLERRYSDSSRLQVGGGGAGCALLLPVAVGLAVPFVALALGDTSGSRRSSLSDTGLHLPAGRHSSPLLALIPPSQGLSPSSSPPSPLPVCFP